MIRQAAFDGPERMLRGALHSHTTRSDGDGTPEEVLRAYASKHFDFVALTDHRIYNYRNFAPDTGITVIPGMEMDRSLPGTSVHCHHIVTIGPEQGEGNGFAQDQRFGTARISTAAECQEMIDMLHANGNMTMYCHPEWSGVTPREFETLRGNFAMEIWNSGCAIENGLDTNAAYWDELLAQGQRIYGAATDDGHAMTHHGNGWVMVRSENSVSAILAALREGAFYSSCGPEIYDFRVEDGVATVECSPVAQIQFRHLRAPYPMAVAPAGESVTRHSVRLRPGKNYVRAVVMDAQGRRAWTNPIFYED